jgi:hypothetical protein
MVSGQEYLFSSGERRGGSLSTEEGQRTLPASTTPQLTFSSK